MSLDRFRQYLQKLNPTAPDAKWSEIWLRRFFEFWKTPHNENLSIDAQRLIAFSFGIDALSNPGVIGNDQHIVYSFPFKFVSSFLGSVLLDRSS